MRHYYNENDPKAATWLRSLIHNGLIPEGHVDERSITEVQPADLVGYVQWHFFAGVSGWVLGLRYAGWPEDREVITGSCPCQPFSSAGKRKGNADDRHLFPVWIELIKGFNQIRERPVEAIFGEQVASSEVVGSELEASFVIAVQSGDYAKANKLAKRLAQGKGFSFTPRWIDGVHRSLEEANYAGRFIVLGAHSVKSPHIRQRLWWMAIADGRDASSEREQRSGEQRQQQEDSGTVGMGVANSSVAKLSPWSWPRPNEEEGSGSCSELDGSGDAVGLANAESERAREGDGQVGPGEVGRNRSAEHGSPGRVGDSDLHERNGANGEQAEEAGDWRDDKERDDGRRASKSSRAGVQGELTRLGEPVEQGLEGLAGHVNDSHQPRRLSESQAGSASEAGSHGHWNDSILIPCRDGKARRIGCRLRGVADGVPESVDGQLPEDAYEIIHPLAPSEPGRTAMLRGYGNAIVPQVAAQFVRAMMDVG